MRVSPTDIIPFRIKNRNAFIKQSHPNTFEHEDDYYKYWNKQAARCIEGFWAKDINEEGEGGYRFMPPNLYFYINLTKIEQEGDEGAQPTIAPHLRDIEWYIFYALMACDGFSGFSNDEETTCLRVVGKIHNGEKLTVEDEATLKKYDKQVKKPDGTYKNYVEAREYLYQTFHKKMGKPLFANPCLDLILLSTRGLGKSYSIANGVIAYDYIFGRNRNVYDWKTRKSTSTNIVGAEIEKKSLALLEKATITISSFEYGIGYCEKKKIWDSDETTCGFFHRPQLGTAKTGLITDNIPDAGKKSKEINSNQIVHVTYGNGKHSAGAGFRGKCIIEEAGLLKNFKAVHAENAGTQKRETKSFYSIYIGTGGDIEKIKEIQEAFYSPRAYTMLPFDNIFDNKSKEIGMFIPAYYVQLRNKDENGNTIIEQAVRDVQETRNIFLQNAKGVDGTGGYDGHIRSYPVVPKEMFRSSAGGRFGNFVAKAEKRIDELEKGLWKQKVAIGKLSPVRNDMVRFEIDIKNELKPIVRYGDERKEQFKYNKESAVLIYEQPDKHKPTWGTSTLPLYQIVYDPVRNDGTGTSIGSILVYKNYDLTNPYGIEDNIVAEWHGRYEKTYDMHEIAIRFAYYYQCSVLFENNIPEFAKYVKEKYPDTWNYILEEEPVLMEKGKLRKRKTGNYGIYMGGEKIPKAEEYFESWISTLVSKKEIIRGDVAEVFESFVIDNIYSLRLLDELILYTREEKTEFDAISAAFLLAIWIQCYRTNPYEEPVRIESKPLNRARELDNMKKLEVYRKKVPVGFDY